MEKLQPSTITLDQDQIGRIDTASAEVLQAEKKEDMEKWVENKKSKKRNKARGRGSVKNETRAQTRIMFEKTRDTKRSQMVADF